MKQYLGYWIDDDNNKWDIGKYSEDMAKLLSKTMIKCDDCSDSSNCYNCHTCDNCNNCGCCVNCINCNGIFKATLKIFLSL